MDIGNLIVGIGSIIGGVHALKTGLHGSPQRSASLSQNADAGPAYHRNLGPGAKGGDTPYKAKFYNVRSIDERVKHVIDQIQKGRRDPSVRAFAVKAVSQKCGKDWCIAERDWWGEIRLVFHAVRKNVRYVRDAYRLDTFQHPKRTLEFAGGDCDDFTITLGSALQSIGFPVKARVIRTKGAPDYNHIFLIVGLPPRAPTKWIALDASINRPPGWHPPRNMIDKIRDFDVP